MTQRLEDIFGELGISQYLDVFLDQGFDTWETILDITESDLDALGVKLGHRRKLQRRIANFRGVAPDAALVSPTRPSVEDPRAEHAHRPDAVKTEARDTTPAVLAKRKYRRHPKPDENAPERPPSAYVLFSNKMREDLRGRNLTFTEIAKLVGENWQNLSQQEKQPFESQAQAAKEKYNHDLSEYKKTTEYMRYIAYLIEFKAKHSNSSQEAPKRVKLSYGSNGVNGVHSTHGASSANGVHHRRTSRSGSGSDSHSQRGSEPPQPCREHRVGSAASVADSHRSSASPTPASRNASLDDAFHSPTASSYLDSAAERSPGLSLSPRDAPCPHPSRRDSGWMEGQRAGSGGGQRSLPSLSDVFDSRSLVSGMPTPAGSDMNGYGGYHRSSHHSGSPGPPPSLIGGDSRPPPLRKDYSAASSASSFSFPRTPIEGSLPIHALLTGKPTPPAYESPQPISSHGQSTATDGKTSSFSSLPYVSGLSSHDLPPSAALSNGNGYFSTPPGQPSAVPPHPAVTDGLARQRAGPGGADEASSLDGMSALLKAGEMVDRHVR